MIESLTSYIDLENWISMNKKFPEEGTVVNITDSDCYGFADYIFECYLKDGFFYNKDGIKMCASYTVSYWKPIDL